MKNGFNFIGCMLLCVLLFGCMGPTIIGNRSMVEFYNATTEGKNVKRADKATSTIDAAKEYDQDAAVSTATGEGPANVDNTPSTTNQVQKPAEQKVIGNEPAPAPAPAEPAMNVQP